MAQPELQPFLAMDDRDGLVTVRVGDRIDSVCMAIGMDPLMAIEQAIKEHQRLSKKLAEIYNEERARRPLSRKRKAA